MWPPFPIFNKCPHSNRPLEAITSSLTHRWPLANNPIQFRRHPFPTPERTSPLNHRFALAAATFMLLAGALSHMPDHAATAAPSAHANVRAEVTAALDHQPLVRVIVSLTEPQALRSSGPLDRVALKTDIRDKQQRALAGLDASDLQLTYQ